MQYKTEQIIKIIEKHRIKDNVAVNLVLDSIIAELQPKVESIYLDWRSVMQEALDRRIQAGFAHPSLVQDIMNDEYLKED